MHLVFILQCISYILQSRIYIVGVLLYKSLLQCIIYILQCITYILNVYYIAYVCITFIYCNIFYSELMIRYFYTQDIQVINVCVLMFQCHSPAHPDSDEVSTSGSELEWISERRSCRLSTDSSELPVFTKICGESG